jgi:hypothetical protein
MQQVFSDLTFPTPLRLEAGGHVEIGFTSDGPGTISVSMNGRLVWICRTGSPGGRDGADGRGVTDR